jgi:hypothetical protein
MDRKRAAKHGNTIFFVFTRSWTQAEVRALKLQILAGRFNFNRWNPVQNPSTNGT